MTALQSCVLPALSHIWPDWRIIAGIDASTMMSLGTWRLVMPRSESTIAISGAFAHTAAMSASIAVRCASGRPAITSSTPPQPLFGSAPAASSTSPCFANTSAKKTFTACPNRIGSETFIIVALRCSENSTPLAFASAICSA